MSNKKFLIYSLAVVARASVISQRQNTVTNASSHCKVLPGDDAWPKVSDWNSLNRTVNGRLIASVPVASVCHDQPFNNYNADTCTTLQNTWADPTLLRINNPSEVLSMYFDNYTCDAFTPRSQACELGNRASYVINVTGVADVKAGIDFARKRNVRLVIKNTGHDYLGKSTGKGALSLWTHNLKSTKYIPNYKSSYYTGPAMKLGAGVEGFEAYAAANATGHRIVGGSCPTVGITGGYSQGGGHSLLSSLHGMGADNVLEWEVVTADGKHLVATPTQNSDLYWAMSGGGGGTYAVALSMTSRLHSDGIVGGSKLTFNDTKVGNDAFWEAIGSYHTLLAPFVDSGNTWLYTLTNNVFDSWVVTMPGADLNKVNALMKPFLDDLTKRGIDYDYTTSIAENYYNHFDHYLGPLPEGITPYAPFTGSRILPRAMFLDPAQNPTITGSLRNASLAKAFDPLACLALNVTGKAHSKNAVLPAWRDSISVCLTPGVWDEHASPAEMAERQDYAANVLQPMLDAASPGGGVYLNEANYKQQNWQKEFYGTNYKQLLAIKNKYDPESLLYAHTAVGSEKWIEDENWRLCKA
ncbi:FAD-binding domain-containing protein [Annulohypoxylon maeteangense]|uniref:FAD-binding domain-containing protein n=1 Tax=Annulohypoxylon maeteangense TaxID=1927788 RepID=UPI002008D4D1|nr:FAD-binding domain-containing protein [Annulohypoxylon maeteangense]KAI0886568.1 FAD-binding domain-containing protein [Annulohypoxylon maeteangense]